jgi:hypothetical protein
MPWNGGQVIDVGPSRPLSARADIPGGSARYLGLLGLGKAHVIMEGGLYDRAL